MVFMRFLIIKILDRLERRCRRAALSLSCPCLVSVRIFRKILSVGCPLFEFCLISVCPDSVYLDFVRCSDFLKPPILSVWIFLSSLWGPESGLFEKRCSLSVPAAEQGRDRGVQTFGVLVRRRRLESDLDMTRPYQALQGIIQKL